MGGAHTHYVATIAGFNFVQCAVDLLKEKTQGHGASRRIAEQVAAAAALVALGVENGHE